jgi:hypothetical protein
MGLIDGSGDTTCVTEIFTNLCTIIVQMCRAASVYNQSIFLYYHTVTSEFGYYQAHRGTAEFWRLVQAYRFQLYDTAEREPETRWAGPRASQFSTRICHREAGG